VFAAAVCIGLPLSRPALAEESRKADIFGHVVLSDGTGVSGVALTLGDSGRVYARTNEEGAYRIPSLALKTYVVHAMKSGYTFAPESRTVTLPTTGKPTSPAAEANFKASQLKTLSITGLIRTNDNKLLPKVAVTLSGEGFATRTATTNANGIYEFGKLPYGKYTVTPKLTGYTFSPEKRNLTIPTKDGEFAPNGRANFLARATPVPVEANIYGYVRTAAGAGVAGIGIYLGDGTTAVATTNDDGKYTIVNPGKGRYVVRPRKEGATFDPASRVVELPTQNLDSSPHGVANFIYKEVKTEGYTIRGRVTSAGVGVAGVGIYIGDGTTAVATTNAEGRYAIEQLATGRYVVKAKKEGATYLPTSRVVELPTSGTETSPNGVANFEAQATTTKYAIRGRVTGGGAGVAGVGIFIGDSTTPSATTNSEGRYAIEELVAGRYVIKAKKEGSTFTPANRVVELPTSGTDTSPNGVANFETEATTSKYAIWGRVTGAGGVGVAGVGIFIGDNTTATATTNSEGRYAIEELVAGRYVLRAKKEGSTFAPANRVVELPTSGTETSPNGVANFETQVATTKYTIRGKITNPAGGPLANVSIRIGDTVRATTNSEGRYAIEGLEAGTYTVTPVRERFTFTPTNKTVTLPTTEGSTLPNAEVNFGGQEISGAAAAASAKSG
jgi:hypothetical protein